MDGGPPTGKSYWWVWLLVLAAGGTVAYFAVTRLIYASSGDNAAKAAASHVIPVLAAPARKGDMNIFLTGLLGTVTPLNTVTVRSRVDGQIMHVAYTEGQMVRQGDLLVQIDPRPFQVQLTQAQGQLAKDQASLKNAQLDLERYESIKSSITQQQIDTQTATVAQFQGAVETDQGQVDNAKLQLVYCNITAPISGRIGLRQVDVGNIIHANDPTGLAVITQIQPITVVFTVAEDQISDIFRRPDHGQGLEVDAYNSNLTTRLATGSVLAIDNQVDPATGTVRIKAQFPNQDNALFPSQFVNVHLLVNTLHGVVIVPSAAVQLGPDANFVYVVKPDKTVQLRNVQVGPTEGNETVIEQGVAPGDVVVTDGVDKLQQGTKVDAHEPASAGAKATTRPAAKASPAAARGAAASRPAQGAGPGEIR